MYPPVFNCICLIFVSSTDLSSFIDQPDIISEAALVQPKPGVFIDDIAHLLVLCTAVSVFLIGVSCTTVLTPKDRLRKEIHLFATDMSIPTEVTMGSVIGTKDGRIFMCGSQDGHLYELYYQEKEGWFGKRIQLVNHSVAGVQSLFPRFTSPAATSWLNSSFTCFHF
jgi:nuclear pore complex protein Nup155